MTITARHRHARMSPRKVRLMRDAVIGLPVHEARAQLTFLPGKAADIILKVLNSAAANAKHNHELDEADLAVRDVVVDAGLVMKRYQPASRGMAHSIKKRTSHVAVVLEPADAAAVKDAPAKKATTQIDTISTQEHLTQVQEAQEEEVAEKDDPKSHGKSSREPSKQERAHQVKKMQQQGGDSAKTHRRKSMSDA